MNPRAGAREGGREEGEGTKLKGRNMASGGKKAFHLSTVMSLWFRLFIWQNHPHKDPTWDAFTFCLFELMINTHMRFFFYPEKQTREQIFTDPESQTAEDIKRHSRKILKSPLRVPYSAFCFIRYDSSFLIFFVNFAIQKIKYSSLEKLSRLQCMDKSYQMEKNWYPIPFFPNISWYMLFGFYQGYFPIAIILKKKYMVSSKRKNYQLLYLFTWQ